jgi:hypothetical protein
MLLQAVKTVEQGADPPGITDATYKIRAIERILPSADHWFDDIKHLLFQFEEAEPIAAQ